MEFEVKNVIAEGTARIRENSTYQMCTIISGVKGNPYEGKFLQTDTVEFEVNSATTIQDAWIDILFNKAPAWVAANYPNVA